MRNAFLGLLLGIGYSHALLAPGLTHRRAPAALWSTTSPEIDQLTPLATFNEQQRGRMDIANAIALDPASCAGDLSQTPVIGFVELMCMAFASATGDDMREKRRAFCERIQATGGYCLVEMEDIEADIINGMWDVMDTLFDNDSSALLRHQTLTNQPDDENKVQNSGYDFVQTCVLDDTIFPRNLHESVGDKGSAQAKTAYELLSQLAKAFASVVYAGVQGCEPQQATELVGRLVDDGPLSFSSSYHRLCQYKPTSDGTSLISHTDWTVSTPIPVSAIAGLEIFHPSTQEWIKPEQTARRLHQNTSDTRSGRRWHSNYVVVMTGNFLELLTGSAFPATIHRVVDDTSSSVSRKSAPFFMRPTEDVFTDMDRLFDSADEETMGWDLGQATLRMQRFLHNVEKEWE